MGYRYDEDEEIDYLDDDEFDEDLCSDCGESDCFGECCDDWDEDEDDFDDLDDDVDYDDEFNDEDDY